MLGLRPVELTILMAVFGFLIAYDFHRTTPHEMPGKRARYRLYAVTFLVSLVALDTLT